MSLMNCYVMLKNAKVAALAISELLRKNQQIRVKYLISEKSDITDRINNNFGKIRMDSCNSLPIEKISIFHNVIRLIKSVVNP